MSTFRLQADERRGPRLFVMTRTDEKPCRLGFVLDVPLTSHPETDPIELTSLLLEYAVVSGRSVVLRTPVFHGRL